MFYMYVQDLGLPFTRHDVKVDTSYCGMYMCPLWSGYMAKVNVVCMLGKNSVRQINNPCLTVQMWI